MTATLAPPNPAAAVSAVLPPPDQTVADLLERLERLGGVPAARIRLHPWPGTATPDDARVANVRGIVCELIDGTLVEKRTGLWDSAIAMVVGQLLRNSVGPRRLGMVAGQAGTFTVSGVQVRMPDVTFTTWARLADADGGRRVWAPHLAPDLAVEVLSPSNTAAEIARKRRELFAGGTRLMWVFDPPTRTIAVYSDADGPPAAVRGAGDTVDGGDVLPGFSLDVAGVFAEAEPPTDPLGRP